MYKTNRIDMPELFDGAYVEIVPSELMPWGAKRRLIKLVQRIEEASKAAKAKAVAAAEAGEEDSEPEQDLELLTEQASKMVASLIVGWNIPPIGATEATQPPLNEDDLERVPGTVVERVMQEIQAAGPTETTPISEPSGPPSDTPTAE
jgi:hypothetical protein